MGKTHSTTEIEVLRFFEDAPIEKAETVFNIVAAKIRERQTPEARTRDRPFSNRLPPGQQSSTRLETTKGESDPTS